MSTENQFKFALDVIVKNFDICQSFDGVVTPKYLEAVAHLRYGLSIAASLLSKCYQTDNYYELLQPVKKQILDRLFNEVERVCVSAYHPQSHEFFIKVIVRQFGMQFLKSLVDQPHFSWLIPPRLKSTKEVRYVTSCHLYTLVDCYF